MIGLLRSLCVSLLDGLQFRLSLWAEDWSLELRRLASLLYWVWLSVFYLMLASGLLVAAVLMAFWEQRAWVTLILALIATVIWGISLWQWQSVLRRPREPWAGTLDQLRRDRASL